MADTEIITEHKRKAKAFKTLNIRALDDPEKRVLYTENLKDKLRAMPFNGDVEKFWKSLKTYIMEVANAICAKRRISGKGKRTDWWTDDLKQIVARKKLAWNAYL